MGSREMRWKMSLVFKVTTLSQSAVRPIAGRHTQCASTSAHLSAVAMSRLHTPPPQYQILSAQGQV